MLGNLGQETLLLDARSSRGSSPIAVWMSDGMQTLWALPAPSYVRNTRMLWEGGENGNVGLHLE